MLTLGWVGQHQYPHMREVRSLKKQARAPLPGYVEIRKSRAPSVARMDKELFQTRAARACSRSNVHGCRSGIRKTRRGLRQSCSPALRRIGFGPGSQSRSFSPTCGRSLSSAELRAIGPTVESLLLLRPPLRICDTVLSCAYACCGCSSSRFRWCRRKEITTSRPKETLVSQHRVASLQRRPGQDPAAPGAARGVLQVNLHVESTGFVSKLFKVEDNGSANLNSSVVRRIHSTDQPRR